MKTIIRVAIITVVTSTILGYGYFRMSDYLKGPYLTVHTPKHGATTHDSLLSIEGTVLRVSEITLNGRKIFIDKEGAFLESILLHPGFNSIMIEALDRFGKKTTEKLDIIYKKPS